MEKFYITTAIPYVNARPHLGHALEFVQADVLARSHREKGEEVLLLSGSDENALKNVQASEQAGLPVQEFIDQNAQLFADLAKTLSVQFDVFQRGSSKEHHVSSQKLWELCERAKDIYKATYEGLYCVGCETFYTPEELNENLECFEHPGKPLEKVSEENYFFRLSKYQDRIIKLLKKGELRVVPESRKNEVLAFLKQPLQDISVSRSNERAKNWGVPVPGDPNQRIFVWFDALNIYQSGIGFGLDEEKYRKWWPADVHVIGKGITRFHAVYWPAFLLSAGLPLPKTLFVHGYITVEGRKMSKSLGNVVDPFPLVEKYGTDAVRYFLLREIPSWEDGDFTIEKFEGRYNADLAGGLGNLSSRILTLAEKGQIKRGQADASTKELVEGVKKQAEEKLLEFRFHESLEKIWELVHYSDKLIDYEKPWEDYAKSERTIQNLLFILESLTGMLAPFLPETAEKLSAQIKQEKREPLFPRL